MPSDECLDVAGEYAWVTASHVRALRGLNEQQYPSARRPVSFDDQPDDSIRTVSLLGTPEEQLAAAVARLATAVEQLTERVAPKMSATRWEMP